MMPLNEFLTTFRAPVIGVDLGTAVIKVAQPAGDTWRTLAIARDPTAAYTEPELRRLARAIERHGFLGTRIRATIPAPMSASAQINTPRSSSGAPIEQIARLELARTIDQDAEALAVRSWPSGKQRERGDLEQRQCFGARTTDIQTIAHAFAADGFDLIALEPSAIAAARAAESPHRSLILDLGWTATRLIAVVDARVIYHRIMPELGIHHLAARLAESWNLPAHAHPAAARTLRDDESFKGACATLADAAGTVRQFAIEITDELDRALTFASDRYTIPDDHPLTLIGGVTPGPLAALIAESASVPIPPGLTRPMPPLFAVAAGVAAAPINEASHA